MISPAICVVSEKGPIEQPYPALSQSEQRMRLLELTVQLLIARVGMGDNWAAGFDDVRNLLAAVPMPTSAFAKTNRHLQNAIGYCGQEEFGAATFELRALRGQIQRL